MSDLALPSTVAFDAFRLLAYLNIAIAVAFLTVLMVALVCCVFELRCDRRGVRRPDPSWRLAVALLLFVCPVGLGAQARENVAVVKRELTAGSLLQDTAKTVTRRIWADAPGAELYAVSPDGRLAASTGGDLVVRDFETGEVRRLTAGAGKGSAEGAAFSRDGEWVAYSWYDYDQPAYYKLGVVDIEGTNPRLIYSDRTTSFIRPEDWSPDGRYILASRAVSVRDATEIVLISVEDGTARLLKSFPNPSHVRSRVMTFSPDGRYVAYNFWRDDPENSDIFVVNVATGEERVLIQDPADDRMLGWAPDGNHVLFRSNRAGTPGAWLLPVADGKPDGTPWLVKPDMWQTMGVGFSRDGRYFYKVTTQRSDVYVANFDPQSRSVVGSPTAISAHSHSNAAYGFWSPDGRHLAYTRLGDEASPVEKIVVQSMETGDVKEFDLGLPGQVRVHSWTADGRALVIFVMNPGDQDNRLRVDLYRIDVQTGRREPLPNPRPSIPLAYPVPASDNGFLLYWLSEENVEGQAASRLLRHELATGDSTLLFQTPFGAWGQIMGSRISPDGQTIAFGYAPVIGQPGGKSLVLLPVTGEAPRELPIAGVIGPAWMPDGRALLFHRFAAPGWDIWYVELADGEPHSIGLTTYGNFARLDIDPQGRRIAYTSGRDGSELWVMENFLPTDASGR